ncbi:hypothetical protein FACS1894167_13320 [Synergistales bacterium]|nr:hypothetical protein FACS1894167_13320 [Synergistales bacterium]
MNYRTELSIKFANQSSYLDELFRIYPMSPEFVRDIDEEKWGEIEDSFNLRDNINLIENLLDLNLFPIKDSYVAYLRRDRSAIRRNPRTINRLCDRIYAIGLDEVYKLCSAPKETNRQIGPLFKKWVSDGGLGIIPVGVDKFEMNDKDAVLDASDAEMKRWCADNLGYSHNKGLDFVGRFDKKYVIGEAKFLTDFGGHQNAQFADAINTLTNTSAKAVTVAILDGVLYIGGGNNKLYRDITETYSKYNILSALFLRDFLCSI